MPLLAEKLSDQWKNSGGVGGCPEKIEAKRETRSNQTYRGTLRQHTRHVSSPPSRGDHHTGSTMFHPLIIGILTVNTSLTIIYWTFILGDAYYKWLMEAEDKPKKDVVSPA